MRYGRRDPHDDPSRGRPRSLSADHPRTARRPNSTTSSDDSRLHSRASRTPLSAISLTRGPRVGPNSMRVGWNDPHAATLIPAGLVYDHIEGATGIVGVLKGLVQQAPHNRSI